MNDNTDKLKTSTLTVQPNSDITNNTNKNPPRKTLVTMTFLSNPRFWLLLLICLSAFVVFQDKLGEFFTDENYTFIENTEDGCFEQTYTIPADTVAEGERAVKEWIRTTEATPDTEYPVSCN